MDKIMAIPVKMVIPSDQRRGIWRGGIIQLQVTRACDLACFHCTQGSNLSGKPVIMTPEDFERAVDSLQGYWGVYGVFGGNPCVSPYFEDYCRILKAKVPFDQRGLWSNSPRGKGKLCRVTFNPRVSNLNVHGSPEAWDDFAKDWPECKPYLKGLDQDSIHSPPWVALQDLIPDEAERWRLIGDCDINKYWSALVGLVPGRGLRAYFCEVAYSQAVLHSGDPSWPDVGLEPDIGWWRLPLQSFEDQIKIHCHACGIPLRREGELAIGGDHEEVSETHAGAFKPKVSSRPVQLVTLNGLPPSRSERPSTEYLPGVTPRR